jgi:hypothetical protein
MEVKMKSKPFLLGLSLVAIVIIVLIIIFNIDSDISKSKQIEGNALSSVASASTQEQFLLSEDKGLVSSFLRFIKNDPVWKKDFNLQYLSSVKISKKWDSIGNVYYFAEVTPDLMWGSELYMIITDNDEIIEVIDTGLGGNSEYFSFDIVNLSQGIFVAVYCASHAGNGELTLAPINEISKAKYSFSDAVDNHYESMRLTAIEYGLAPEYSLIELEEGEEIDGKKAKASAVYLGGKLCVDYGDVNLDGSTDVVLTGIQRIYEEGNNNEQILKQEYYIKKVYIYDHIIDEFVFNDKLSLKIQL